MSKSLEVVFAFTILALVAALLWALYVGLRKIAKRNTNVPDHEDLWTGKDYRCPACQSPLEQGFAHAGKGIVWRSRLEKKPGTFAHIGQVLDNTLSLRLPPALNMAWHCSNCSLLLLDHSRLVMTSRRRRSIDK
jgi:hypothetical protein